jgi:rubrerythrin
VFADIGDFTPENGPEQADVYMLALEKEKQSIALYRELLDQSVEDKDLFEFLIAQEEEHQKTIESILETITRPGQWVESAEFGVREDY